MRWEYKRIAVELGELAEDSFEERLNEHGGEGWELVFAVDHQRHGFSKRFFVVFKRGIPDAPSATLSEERLASRGW